MIDLLSLNNWLAEMPAVVALLSLLLALLLDKWLGEASRFHPLVGFGHYASWLEKRLNAQREKTTVDSEGSVGVRALGVLALLLALLPLLLLALWLSSVLAASTLLQLLVGGFVLYVALGWQSLLEHARAIARPLSDGDLPAARLAVGMIVSRDAQQLDNEGVAKAATESVLENGGDAVFSAVFWFLVAGIPGVVMFRLANTLDAMWGYKSPRFLYFGWAAARFDDILNLIPARLTALSYALVGTTGVALRCWQQQGFTWKSPNAGPVMSAGAGALNVSLGGAATYHDGLQQRPQLGPVANTDVANNIRGGQRPSAATIFASCTLVNRALLLWCGLLLLASMFSIGASL